MMVVEFQSFTGWWISWNDIVGIYTKDFCKFIDMCAILELWCKVQVCHAALRSLIWLSYWYRLEETQLHWTWYTWCYELRGNLRDQIIVVSEVGLFLEIAVTLGKNYYKVWYQVCLWIKKRPWYFVLK